jgi:LacI family transcriptional regulator
MANITIRDIAERASVSVSTVSLVLRDSPLVRQETRERVKQAAADIGYVYNRSAASLRSRQTGVVGLCVNDLTNPYFAEMVAGIERALYALGRTVLMSDAQEDPARQLAFVEKMREYSVDGLLVSPAHAIQAPRLAALVRASRIPCVLVSRDLPGSGLDYAGYNHRDGMLLAVEHLIASGHRRIALLGGSRATWVGSERVKGYRLALAGAGLPHDPVLEIEGPLTRQDGMRIIERVLALEHPPTAAACANDVFAFGVMLGLRRRGLEPGRDFAVTGNDNIAEAALWTPSLTTVDTDFQVIGSEAVRMLLERIKDPSLPPRHLVLPVHLEVRNSSMARS